MPSNYVLLGTVTVGASGASTVSFDNIPQSGYTDLLVNISVRTARTGTTADSIGYRFNNTTTGYSESELYGNGSTTSAFSLTTFTPAGQTWGRLDGGMINTADTTANTFTSIQMYIPNYRSSNTKSFSVDIASENKGTAYQAVNAGIWSNTAAITSISFRDNNLGVLVAGCTFSLYGIAALNVTPVIAPKATGGNIIVNDGTYWYHAFTSTGTFTPTQALTADAIVIGGGGGGGGDVGGGGGAARVYGLTSLAMASATNYACTVGAGGGGAGGTPPAITASPNAGLKGTDSSLIGGLLSYTSLGGGGGQGRSYGTAALNNGWSGGGQSYNSDRPATAGNGGYAGGATSGVQSNPCYCGGGGGTTSAGTNSTNGGTSGGAGTSTYSSWASATGTGVGGAYAGGGGGGNYGVGGYRSYGQAGGGYGSYDDAAQSATANTGSGGGGAGSSQYAGNGGSGIVIIRYTIA